MSRTDLVTGHETSYIHLYKKTKLIPQSGDRSPEQFVDGCSVYGLAYDPRDRTLYTISPENGSYRSEGRRFRLLAFHVPDMTFLRSFALPDLTSDEDFMRPEVDASGSISVRLVAKKTLSLRAGKLVAVPDTPAMHLTGTKEDPEDLDVSGYRFVGLPEETSPLSYEELQASGDAVLIRSYPAGGQAWAIVHVQQKSLVALHPNFQTSDESYYLAPGGRYVLVQQSKDGDSIGTITATMGHRFVLMDSATGAVLHKWNKPSFAGTRLKGLSPSGVGILWGHGRTRFLHTGMHFSSGNVRLFGEDDLAGGYCIFADY